MKTTLLALALLVPLAVERRGSTSGLLPVAVALLLYAWTRPRAVEPLIPIFRSAWLTVHVVTAAIACSAFAVTFVACGLFLHARWTHGWQGRRAVVLGIIGFAFVVTTSVGIDLLAAQRHRVLPWHRR